MGALFLIGFVLWPTPKTKAEPMPLSQAQLHQLAQKVGPLMRPMDPVARAGISKILTQTLPANFTTFALASTDIHPLGERNVTQCEATFTDNQPAVAHPLQPQQMIQMTAHRMGLFWVVDRTDVDSEAFGPDEVKRTIEDCVAEIEKTEDRRSENRTAWQQLNEAASAPVATEDQASAPAHAT
jgi:hypothetical protein